MITSRHFLLLLLLLMLFTIDAVARNAYSEFAYFVYHIFRTDSTVVCFVSFGLCDDLCVLCGLCAISCKFYVINQCYQYSKGLSTEYSTVRTVGDDTYTTLKYPSNSFMQKKRKCFFCVLMRVFLSTALSLPGTLTRKPYNSVTCLRTVCCELLRNVVMGGTSGAFSF